MNNQEANTIEIDVLALLRTIWRKKFLILLTAILTTGLAFAYSAFLVTPQYDSTTRLYNEKIKEHVLSRREHYIKEYSWDSVADRVLKVIKANHCETEI